MSICYDVCIHFIGCVWENDEPKERQKAMNRKIWKALGKPLSELMNELRRLEDDEKA